MEKEAAGNENGKLFPDIHHVKPPSTVSELEYLSASPRSSRRQSLCKFRDLPKRYEATLARHRIQLTRKAFPLAERKLDLEVDEFTTTNGFTGASGVNFGLYSKPFLVSGYSRSNNESFKKFGRKKVGRRNASSEEESSNTFILPEIVKICPQERICLQKQKRKVGIVDGPPPTPELKPIHATTSWYQDLNTFNYDLEPSEVFFEILLLISKLLISKTPKVYWHVAFWTWNSFYRKVMNIHSKELIS